MTKKVKLPPLPDEGIVIPAMGMLKEVRERVGLSQPALARECGLSRNVIANYESGRTKWAGSFEDVLRVWRVLEVKERALNISKEERRKGPSAAEAVLGLLWLAKLRAQKRLVDTEGQIENLERQRESIVRHIADIEAEEAQRKGSV